MEISYFGEYYTWADNRIINFINEIDNKREFDKKNEPYGRSIRDLVEHIAVSYEMIFNIPKFQEDYKLLMDKIKKYSWINLLKYWKKWLGEFVRTIEDDSFPISESSSMLSAFKDDYIFAYSDHSTYLRGQLTVLLNLSGNKVINTDHFTFSIEKSKLKSN